MEKQLFAVDMIAEEGRMIILQIIIAINLL